MILSSELFFIKPTLQPGISGLKYLNISIYSSLMVFLLSMMNSLLYPTGCTLVIKKYLLRC
jgi:hypothetical protein